MWQQGEGGVAREFSWVGGEVRSEWGIGGNKLIRGQGISPGFTCFNLKSGPVWKWVHSITNENKEEKKLLSRLGMHNLKVRCRSLPGCMLNVGQIKPTRSRFSRNQQDVERRCAWVYR